MTIEARKLEEAAKQHEGKKTLENIKKQAVVAKIEERKREILEEQKRLREEEKLKTENTPEDCVLRDPNITIPGIRHRKHRSYSEDVETNPINVSVTLHGNKTEVIR